MIQNWLNKKNNSKLIVFFNGWGMDEKAVQHLKYGDYDIIEIYDYQKIENPEFDTSSYSEKYLISWSMGVYVSGLFYEQFKDFNKKIALAGTPKIIDDNFGIPSKIYDFTIKHLKPDDFIKLMAPNKSDFKFSRTKEELIEELISIKNLEIKQELEFDKVIVPLKDRIVPTQNQLNFWKNKNIKLEKLACAHYIFDCYTSWHEILC